MSDTMTDRYENIRRALAMGPTPGPWEVWDDVIYYDNGNFQVLRHFVTAHEADVVGAYGVEADRPSAKADAAHIAACHPGTIRALLAEMDSLRAALEAAREDADRYRWLADNVESLPYPDMWRDKEWLDAAIDQARGKEDGNVR